ncbi:MAG TPA: extracellular solute-binding protein [Pseudonocardiaceae bacterium]|jgi:multiple sugar transport system substrate-binding protein|nr:extracellular solute-binding protein [Pseudonocardiaceae bacterium]
MRTAQFHRLAAAALAAGAAVTVMAACTSSNSDNSASGSVTITVNCEPPTSDPIDRKAFVDDIATFEKAHSNIHIQPKDEFPCDDPKTFDAKLAGGQMENVFYVYYTDVAHVIAEGQAADISKYTGSVKGLDDIQASTLGVFKGPNGDFYGLPKTNYSMGLLYSRALFTQAGLDPNSPPTTWDEVRADAKKIAALGNGIVGYADYSASNQGGWHFTAEIYSQGGSMVSSNGKQAAFDSAAGKAVLTNLQQMRWTDNSMGSKQLLTIPDVQAMMGAGKLGMYVAAPDNLPTLVKQYQGSYTNLAIAPMPGDHATLLGGDGYMFNVKDTPAQIQAGIQWLQFENLTPGVGQFNYQRSAANGSPVGLPEPDLWKGTTATTDDQAKAKYANVPSQNDQSFITAMKTKQGDIEPVDAQQIYSVLDSVMSAVLTNQGANIDQLLSDASTKVNSLLANQ